MSCHGRDSMATSRSSTFRLSYLRVLLGVFGCIDDAVALAEGAHLSCEPCRGHWMQSVCLPNRGLVTILHWKHSWSRNEWRAMPRTNIYLTQDRRSRLDNRHSCTNLGAAMFDCCCATTCGTVPPPPDASSAITGEGAKMAVSEATVMIVRLVISESSCGCSLAVNAVVVQHVIVVTSAVPLGPDLGYWYWPESWSWYGHGTRRCWEWY
jgi:hypothetical protein